MSEGQQKSNNSYVFKTIPDAKKDNFAVIAFVSNSKTMEVKGAFMTKLQ